MDEYKYKDIKILHRLDKQTSGIVIFAKNKISADIFRSKLHTDDVQKIYFARVKGNFEPKDKRAICKKYIKALDKSRGIHTDVSDTEVENYLKNKNDNAKKDKKDDDNKNKNNIININKDEENNENAYDEKNEPKYAETEFEFLFYDEKSNTSVVKCYPKNWKNTSN